MDLDNNDRLMILAAAFGMVAATALLVICKICPWCYLRKHCPLRAKYPGDSDFEEDEKLRQEVARKALNGPDHQFSGYGKHLAPNLVSDKRQKHSQRDSKSQRRISPLSLRAKQLSSVSYDSYGSNLSLTSNNSTATNSPQQKASFAYSPEPAPTPSTELDFGLQYDCTDERLAIYIRKAKNLPRNLRGGASDCVLRVVLVRDLKKGWVRKRPSGISLEDITSPGAHFDTVEFKTQVHRRSLNPEFNAYFAAELKEKDRKYAIIKFAICTADKVGRFSVAAECHLSLGKLDLSNLEDFTKPLKQYRPDIGELLLSLNYLPTAERICLTIIKAAHLKLPSGGNAMPNVFVKVALIYRGKVVDKRKTGVQWSCTSPEFQEAIIFDLPASELDKTTLVITVAHQELAGNDPTHESRESGHETSTSSGGAISDDTTMSKSTGMKTRRRSAGNLLEVSRVNGSGSLPHKSKSSGSVHSKTFVLGRLAISQHVQSATERSHWLEMVRSPRTVATHWHKLVP